MLPCCKLDCLERTLRIDTVKKVGEWKECSQKGSQSQGAPVTAFTDLPGQSGSLLAQQTWPRWSGLCSPISTHHWLWVFERGKDRSATPTPTSSPQSTVKKKKKIFEFFLVATGEIPTKISKHGLDDAEDVTSSSWERSNGETQIYWHFPTLLEQRHRSVSGNLNLMRFLLLLLFLIWKDSQIFLRKERKPKIVKSRHTGGVFAFFWLGEDRD